jgi:hypothetical protein
MFEEFKIKYLGIQPVGKVSTNQLEGLIAREFPRNIDEITLKFNSIKADNPNAINRISAAILNLSNKDISKIDSFIEMSNNDSRDVLALAEYPRYSKLVFSDLNNKRKKTIYLEDWAEYSKWIND